MKSEKRLRRYHRHQSISVLTFRIPDNYTAVYVTIERPDGTCVDKDEAKIILGKYHPQEIINKVRYLGANSRYHVFGYETKND